MSVILDGRAMFTGDSAEWETPGWLFERYDRVFRFDLDVCATEGNAKCAEFYDKERSGLLHEWRGNCWMNPPYGRGIGAWVKKAWEASQEGATVVCLLPARTDTKWWHEYVSRAGYVEFMKGRLRFSGAEQNAPFPSAVVIFFGFGVGEGEGWGKDTKDLKDGKDEKEHGRDEADGTDEKVQS